MAVTALFLVQAACAEASDLDSAPAVRLDGRIADGEWAGASRHDLAGGGEVFVKWEDESLYLAVRGEAFGWSHVYATRGDSLFVLHASAALGTAIYSRGAADDWERTSSFEWAVRDTTFSVDAEAARAAFFAEHGWIANTNRMGTRGVIEFRIAADLVGAPESQLAVIFASDPEEPLFWPSTLNDDTLDAVLIAGQAPERLNFEPATWANLDLPR